MQVIKIISYINDNEQLRKASGDDLVPLINEFPYCQTGQLMYAFHLHAVGSIAFDEQLKKTAAYVGEREKLFHLIHPKEEFVEQTPVPTEVKVEDPRTEVTEKPVEQEVEQDEEMATLEKEYLTQAISSSILIESDEEVQNLESADEQVEEQIEEVNLFDESKEHSFNDWLKHFNGEEISDAEQAASSKKANFELIDKFIQEDPRIEPNKERFYSPSNMARKSVTDQGFVSETLAMIHMDQGNYEQAIETYEKLILNNPKKRSYFASQIKILKQKLKQ